MNFETMLPDEQLLSEEQQGNSFASLCVTVHSVPIKLCGNAFLGLSRQNLDFPHSLYEITDNNIAATPPGEKTIVRIHLMRHPSESEKILVTIPIYEIPISFTGAAHFGRIRPKCGIQISIAAAEQAGP